MTGQWDGRGVIISPGKFVQIATFDGGRGSGEFTRIAVEDLVITQGAMKMGKLDGRFVYTLPNGEKQTENYKDGNFIGY